MSKTRTTYVKKPVNKRIRPFAHVEHAYYLGKNAVSKRIPFAHVKH